MSRLTKTKRSRKKLSRFHKLWNQAEKLKKENEIFRNQLDALVQRMQTEILPVEREAAAEQVPLLKRLLTLGQRKSLSQWQRHELFEWIMELVGPLQSSGQMTSELQDDIARFNAFNHGIKLDEDSEESLSEQVDNHVKREAESFDEGPFGETPEQLRARIEAEVEQILDDTLGPPPKKPEDQPPVFDLFEDELADAQQQAYEDYFTRRAQLREQLIEDELAEAESGPEDPFDDFDPFSGKDWADPDPQFDEPDTESPALSSEVFTRLFRTTAAVLHPDREPDDARRETNHQLMSELLKARKQGDVMTVLSLYQEHVGGDSGLSGKDEKQLIAALQHQIQTLKMERDEYSFSSPMHRTAFDIFYTKSRKKTDDAFRNHIEHIKNAGKQAGKLAAEIKSLKTLKPYLEERYEEFRPEIDVDAFIDEMIRKATRSRY